MENGEIENWKQIDGFEKYLVSDQGSVAKILKNGTLRKLKPFANRHGYRHVSLHRTENSLLVRLDKQVHRLVIEAFRGKDKRQCNHINGIKSDNRLDNLEYVTPQENIRHAIDTGLTKNREKLTADQKLQIKSMLPAMSGKQIAEKLGLKWISVSKIKVNLRNEEQGAK